MTDIFALTSRPDSELFFQRNEAGDPRLGETVRHLPDDYASAQVVILGCPQDEGVRRNGGRVGAAQAPTEIRRMLYRLVSRAEWPDGALFDLGDTLIKATLEATHTQHQQAVEQVLRDHKRVIVLGGGNDVSYPDASAMSAVFGAQNLTAFNIDAHLDVRESPERHSGTPYRQLLEEGRIIGKNFHEWGGQQHALAQSHLNYLHGHGVDVLSPVEIRNRGGFSPLIVGREIGHEFTPVQFFGVDVDSVRASDAPGVSAPNPAGFTADEFLSLCAAIAELPGAKLLEFSEVNPTFDLDGRTARLVAVGIWHFLSGILA
jgi:formimidoylglutamase